MNNNLIRFNNWLDKNETFKFIFMILSISIGIINIQLGSFIFGITSISLFCLFTFNRILIVDGRIKFNKSKYDVPQVGETVVIKKKFYWDGEFNKNFPKTDMGSKPWYFTIRKGDEWAVVDVKELNSDWVIYLSDSKDSIDIRYFESKDYWETKSSIRNKKLNKLGL